jgi:hypothetical protein
MRRRAAGLCAFHATLAGNREGGVSTRAENGRNLRWLRGAGSGERDSAMFCWVYASPFLVSTVASAGGDPLQSPLHLVQSFRPIRETGL